MKELMLLLLKFSDLVLSCSCAAGRSWKTHWKLLMLQVLLLPKLFCRGMFGKYDKVLHYFIIFNFLDLPQT